MHEIVFNNVMGIALNNSAILLPANIKRQCKYLSSQMIYAPILRQFLIEKEVQIEW